ncbi:MAG: bifunctional DNA-formamidopyrimidine glycosylase/DNA-(apurinic or apyrimidinic site) lyase [Desulfovibrionaceae bacterium]|nr:bifunctional DNA-formamidopyrimidine glycosylase/DNA-(apurinic or apyrimidinic site) lyase [Desulfovibrionaceae bacterium]MBF0514597.1 bifunctional DNA-formamidopyrimidine glycosylase/DNA-(apurinic or apyrimidinic site) lyase [Desulfovibrionaceae bacterium]
MPELPEVETIARALSPVLTGRRIVRALVLDPSVLPNAGAAGAAAFRALTEGRVITAVRRRAKLCLIDLSGGAIVAVHLKMTGRLSVADALDPPPARARLIFALEGGGGLVFSDLRRFGSCRAFAPGAIEGWEFYRTLGPEPLAIGAFEFIPLFAKTSRAIKAALLDQRVIAGIGNIYADEALFRAGIRPEAKANAISPERLAVLHAAVQAVLTEAVEAGGSTIRDYRTPEGIEGAFQHHFKVYGRAGQKCPACGKKLVAAKIAARTSTYCPGCQKK